MQQKQDAEQREGRERQQPVLRFLPRRILAEEFRVIAAVERIAL